MIVTNKSEKHTFFNKGTEEIYNNLYDYLNIEIVSQSNLEAHHENISNYYTSPDEYLEVIPGIVPIPPRTKWHYDGFKFKSENKRRITKNLPIDLNGFLEMSKRFFEVIKKKKLGIELSGGLDTSIIIGLAKYFDIDPCLIGIESPRFELRTERQIQLEFCKDNSNAKLLDEENTLPFTSLLNSPLHQLPSSTSLYFKHAEEIAKEFSKNEGEILLSGMGLDAILCPDPFKEKKKIPPSWSKWKLDDNWFNEYIYSQYNINYKSAASSDLIIQAIWFLRNSGDDNQKIWARSFFKDLIPERLTSFAYKADNSGGFVDGFLRAKPQIEVLFKKAYEITGNEEFSKSSLKILFLNAHLPNEERDKIIMSRISFANWIFGLIRDNKI